MAHSRHWSRTWHREQTDFADSTWEAAGPVVPTGKNSSGSSSLQRARCTQSIRYAPPRPVGGVCAWFHKLSRRKRPEGGREYTDAPQPDAMVAIDFPPESYPLVVAHRGASAELPE